MSVCEVLVEPTEVIAEAVARYPLSGFGSVTDGIQTHRRSAFAAGAEWALRQAARKAAEQSKEVGSTQ